MKTYVATATREGQWWVVDVEGIGMTQGRNLAEAKVMAGDLIETMAEETPTGFEVDLHVTLDDTILSGIRDARSAVESLTAHQLATAQLSRKAARDLVNGAGLSGRDGALSSVSHPSGFPNSSRIEMFGNLGARHGMLAGLRMSRRGRRGSRRAGASKPAGRLVPASLIRARLDWTT